MEDRHVIISPFTDLYAGAAAASASASASARGGRGGSGVSGEHGVNVGAGTCVSAPCAGATFVGVYDGHNGALAAEHAAQHLHTLLAADPALQRRAAGASGAADASSSAPAPASAADAATAAAAATSAAPPPASASERDSAVADALVRAFLAVDAQILAATAAGGTREGATALVALRLGGALFTAHAGDSRGVAAVAGRAARLTRDHTPACAHEAARVRARGGHLEFAGCWRVCAPPPAGPPRPRAALAVTRALGDLSFKHPTPCVPPPLPRGAKIAPHLRSFAPELTPGIDCIDRARARARALPLPSQCDHRAAGCGAPGADARGVVRGAGHGRSLGRVERPRRGGCGRGGAGGAPRRERERQRERRRERRRRRERERRARREGDGQRAGEHRAAGARARALCALCARAAVLPRRR
jgi:serine/threonine protein phosphatase PrpC